MSIKEIALCFIGFGTLSLLSYFYMKKRQKQWLKKGLVFLPGFILANIISYIVSKPGDSLFSSNSIMVTDQPIFIGFPFTFFEIEAWGSLGFYLFPLIVNLVLIITSGFFLLRLISGDFET